MKLLPRILAAEDDEDEQAIAEPAEIQPEPETQPLHWGWTVALAVAAAVPRLLYLFVFSDPENPGIRRYDDVWHHWQIAYLTKEIGLSVPGGPRLWDLKGLDYFWGVLHPLLMVIVFDLTGSIDIVLNRLVTVAFGVLVVVLLFHICRRYWGTHVAIGAGLIAILLPTSVMNDASGMLEPMGVALVLVGLWAWPRRGILGGPRVRPRDYGPCRGVDLQPRDGGGRLPAQERLAAADPAGGRVRGRDAGLHEGAPRPNG